MPERIWHPISKLEFFVEHTRRWLADVKENAEALEEARTRRPAVRGGVPEPGVRDGGCG
ncbi:hypothetical protein ACFRQM_49135 [Streptomyces sp. NPDC056831]|uniref:hypothetical protein n=1 Tax=Streptomyces sp. NPDC056831 TaxID=3345954 RepID=UPI0036B39105